ncbi:MAG: hypothetical protein HQL56_14790 [Magnetococcales bacterium]|nr:hypothetical protein [Magnetococcales bacterium]
MSRILIINENPFILSKICALLQARGHQTVVASTVGEAMFLCMLWHPVDVIVSDLLGPCQTEFQWRSEGIISEEPTRDSETSHLGEGLTREDEPLFHDACSGLIFDYIMPKRSATLSIYNLHPDFEGSWH